MNSLWVAKTGLDAQQAQIRTIANNLANANTIGYKKGRDVFASLFYQNIRVAGGENESSTILPVGKQFGNGVKVMGIEKEFSTGAPLITNKSLDLMIENDTEAFFKVTNAADGNVYYTRDGGFQRNQDGLIVHTATGYSIESGITVPQDAATLEITRDGLVLYTTAGSTTQTQAGQIQLHKFVNPPGLTAVGNNLFSETPASGTVIDFTVQDGTSTGAILSGTLEKSNVNMVEEMVKMIETQRSYEVNTKILSTSSQMMQNATQNIG